MTVRRFNDVHKELCRILELDEMASREIRTYMVRYHSRGFSPLAILALTRQELARRAAIDKLATEGAPSATAAPALPRP